MLTIGYHFPFTYEYDFKKRESFNPKDNIEIERKKKQHISTLKTLTELFYLPRTVLISRRKERLKLCWIYLIALHMNKKQSWITSKQDKDI
jgi:hypothetical protein